MVQYLSQNQKGTVGFASTQGDVEAHQWKEQLMSVFAEAGWKVQDCKTFMFFGEKDGFVVTIPFNTSITTGLPQVTVQALNMTGNPISWNEGDMANEVGIYVQVWHAPQD
ncbi:MAG: hypothetical protein VCE91_12735 [Nitrospinota bacterium]